MVDILKQGENCWTIASAKRGAFLIDAADYFLALKAALLKAQRQVLIAGWDINSKTDLDPKRAVDDAPGSLADLLRHVTGQNPDLHIYILLWDYAAIYMLEREGLPWINLDWRLPDRVHLCLDSTGSPGMAHHQKTVVIDDCLAFCGGIDLTERRWDTSNHDLDDPHRVTADGRSYRPFHDVQLLVDGETAVRLGEDLRRRWAEAHGETLTSPTMKADPWPDGTPVDIHDVSVAIARTRPPGTADGECREVERLYLDSIRAAADCIYIENQYLTSMTVCDALAVRLEEPGGPEIIVVTPAETSGWLEEQVMGAGRARFVGRLREADRYGRLRIYVVQLETPDGLCLNVHAKVMIVDQRLARVGSANLNNRSMGFDSECDLAIEAQGPGVAREAIAALQTRLLGEHLSVETAVLTAAHNEAGNWRDAIDSLRREQGHTLRPIDVPDAPTMPEALRMLADPEAPVEAGRFLTEILSLPVSAGDGG